MSDDRALILRLLAAENPRNHYAWPNDPKHSLADCQLSRDDIPGLIRVLQHWPDESWPDKNDFAEQLREKAELLPVTAWRALGELCAVEAVGPLIEQLRALPENKIDDWITEEWPHLFALLGAPASEPLLGVALDTELPWVPRSIAITCLRKIVEQFPETRAQIVPCLVELMEQADDATNLLSSCLLMDLVELQAVEAAKAIERAFSRNALDLGMMGDWEMVRQKLGVPGLGLPMPEKPFNSIQEWQEKLKIAESIERMKRQLEEEQEIIANERLMNKSYGSGSATLRQLEKIGRNDPCSCGSGKKYKKCCGRAF